jgi:hypothetical protein
MASIIKASLLLLVLKAAANPYLAPTPTGLSASLPKPAELLKLHLALNDGPTSTAIVTETTTLYATLIPPVLPAVTISTSRTDSIFTSTTTQTVNLNCTVTAYSAVLAPTPLIGIASLSVSSPAARAARQVTGSSSSSLKLATSSSNNPNVVTSTVGGK